MIGENIEKIRKSIPEAVTIVAAAKQRSPDEIREAIKAGVCCIGENYIQQACSAREAIGDKAQWHFIGHLQKNKVKLAVSLFDMIETIDSLSTAQALDRECQKINKKMPILIEVNSACEPQKSGVMPEEVEHFVAELMNFKNMSVCGLMTMGPWLSDVEKIRPFFKITKELFDTIALKYPGNKQWKHVSMGMSTSYKIAISEGATMVRIGEAIFGPRKGQKV